MLEYDVVVIGVGGVGSAALYHLARRGKRVLGIDRFPPGHARGSSHGETRVIRLAYFEDPCYVPLLRRAFESWEQLQELVRRPLYVQTGLLEVGPPNGVVVPGVLASAKEHGLSVETLDARTLMTRYAPFSVPTGYVGVFEHRAGYLKVEACVLAHAEAACELGAHLRIGSEVRGVDPEPDGVVVHLADESILADRIVLSPGPWARPLLEELGLGMNLEVRRKTLFWFDWEGSGMEVGEGFPVYLFETTDGVFYGFPPLDVLGLKVAEHTSGSTVDDPLTVDRAMRTEDLDRVKRFLTDHLPEVNPVPIHHTVCMYTMTPDDHFVLGLHPDDDRIAVAAGLSGHGFKFANVLGEVAADLVIDGGTELPIEALSLTRPGLMVE